MSSIEETYEAVQTFEILGIESKPDLRGTACSLVSEVLGTSSSPLKDLFYALKVSSLLKCDAEDSQFEVSWQNSLIALVDLFDHMEWFLFTIFLLSYCLCLGHCLKT